MWLCLLALLTSADDGAAPAAPSSQPAASLPVTIAHLDTPEVILGVETEQRGEPLTVRVWLATPADPAWRPLSGISRFPHAVGWHAPRDGEYSFYFVVENAVGRSASDPSAESPPHARVIVDTSSPTLQLHRVVPRRASDGRTCLRMDLTVFDENLGERGLRLFTRRSADDEWQDSGEMAVVNGRYDWFPPADCPAELDLRVIATDLAGNQSRDGILRVSTRVAASLAAPAPQSRPTEEPPAPAASSAPSEPPSVDPQVARSVEYLRRLAEREVALDRPSLAVHRLRDAVALSPNDAGLRGELARVLLQSGRLDEAGQQYENALRANPDDLDALEGLALTAAAQRRYPDAAERLRTLLDRSPETGRLWLRFGDIQHKLGHSDEARDAWDKVLSLEPDSSRLRTQARERLDWLAQQPPATQPSTSHRP